METTTAETSKQSRRLKIVLPFLPPSWNKVLGGTLKERCVLKKLIQHQTWLALPNDVEQFQKRVLIHFLIWTHEKNSDVDNFSPKWIIDTIRRHGILADDKLEYVHGVSLQAESCSRDVAERTVVLIREMEPWEMSFDSASL